MTLDFEPWYRDVRPGLVEAIARATADGVASDAVDEALTRALERWDRVATLRSPSGWVYTVALNAARRTFRRQATEADRVRVTPTEALTEPLVGGDLRHLVAGLPARQAAWASPGARCHRPCERPTGRLPANSDHMKEERPWTSNSPASDRAVPTDVTSPTLMLK